MDVTKIAEEHTDEVLNFTKDVLDKFGPRLAGSKSALASADYIKKKFDEVCNTTFTEEFYCHPKAFLGSIRLQAIFGIIAAVFLPFIPLMAFFPIHFIPRNT